MYRVFSTETYDKQVAELPSGYRELIERFERQLAEDPYVGRGLTYRFLREKRIRERRIYYLVYDDLILVLLVGTSKKKQQQKTIQDIKKYLPEFKRLAASLHDSSDSTMS